MLCLLARQSDSELTWYCGQAASSTDGNNYNFSSSGRPGVNPFTALRDLSVQPQLASGSRTAAVLRDCQSGGPLQNCLRATVTLRPGPGLRLPSPPGRAQGIQVTRKAHAGDVMASAEGAAGPAPGVRHQPAGGVHPNSVSNRLIPSTESALHQRWWCSGMKSRSSCIRFWVRIRR